MGRKPKNKNQDANPNMVHDRVGESTDLSVCPICEKHTDCFANMGGRCTALKKVRDTTDCPFYKNADANNAECRHCFQRLKENGRYDLISKYIVTLSALGLLDDEFEMAEQCSEELELFRERNYHEQLDAMKDEAGLDYDLLSGAGDATTDVTTEGSEGGEESDSSKDSDREVTDDRNT